MAVFRLAHFSDPHLAFQAPWPGLAAIASKRSLSQLSWQRGRRHLQRPELLAALLLDIRAQASDHLLVTGDITNFSYPGEFSAAAKWLAALGRPDTVSVVPGNHDALVPAPWQRSLGKWQDWMSTDMPSLSAAPFPYLRVRGAVAVVGLSSAVPTTHGLASGRLGGAQLERLESLLNTLRGRGLCRILALHHPPAEGAVSWRKALRDSAAFRAVLARSGAELVLHGHSREARFDTLPGPGGPVVSLGLPSSSAIPNPKDEGARWHLLTLESSDSGWRCGVTVRRLNDTHDGFKTAATYRLLLNA